MNEASQLHCMMCETPHNATHGESKQQAHTQCKGQITTVCFNCDSSILSAAYDNGNIVLWSIERKEEDHHVNMHRLLLMKRKAVTVHMGWTSNNDIVMGDNQGSVSGWLVDTDKPCMSIQWINMGVNYHE